MLFVPYLARSSPPVRRPEARTMLDRSEIRTLESLPIAPQPFFVEVPDGELDRPITSTSESEVQSNE
jgi:hypothetical protein